jgi:outer membrane protein assembly factor BamB
MARREYVSFLGERRRDFGYYDSGPDPARWLLLGAALVLIAISVWWFGFREADDVAITERVLQDTTIPTLLLPADTEQEDAGLAAETYGCQNVIEEWTTFQGSVERQGCITAPRIETPRVLWRSEVGVSGWLNNPVIEDGIVYVGSAGAAQFASDRLDGIYSLLLATGELRWRYTTELDVNAVSVGNGVVVGVGDEGRVWAIDGGSGDLLWTTDLQVGVFASPLIIDDIVVIGAGSGDIVAFDLETGGDPLWREQVAGPVRGGLAADDQRIYAAGETHEVLALTHGGEQVWRANILARGANADDTRIFAAPTVTEDLVVVTFVRTNVFAEPAIEALDKFTGEEVWRSEDSASLKVEWANIRSSPAVAGDWLVYAEGYSDELVIIDLATGQTSWSANVGPFCYPHWPSVAVNNGYAYVARHDGGLYAVDLSAQESEHVWRIYLGRSGVQGFPDGHACDWGPEDGFSILASPAVSPEGVVVIGTLEGQLVAVGDRDW